MDPLAQLKDIHLPDPVGMWPPAAGWWISALLILLVLSTAILFVRKWRHQRKARAQAIAELKVLNADNEKWPEQLNSLLKRAAMSYFPRHTVASLHGEAWSVFLAEHVPAKQAKHICPALSQLNRAVYDPHTPAPEFDAALAASKTWLLAALPPKHHGNRESVHV